MGNYDKLRQVLRQAMDQAQYGKGKQRHASNEPFQEQKICQIGRWLGSEHGCLQQAIKKAIESTRLDQEPAIQELYGAIIYLAGAVILRSEKVDKKENKDATICFQAETD